MKDHQMVTVDECMRQIGALIEYFKTNAERMPGSASQSAKQMKDYAEALTMARDAMKEKYYSL